MPKKKSTNKDSRAKSLRQQAEARLRTSPTDIANMPTEDVQSLVHELQVHQIELEIQNEELRQAQIELADSRDRYSDLYEYAPAGYLALDQHGTILQANLSATGLLAIDRQELVGAKFPDFVDRDGQDAWHFHHQAVFAGAAKQTCELPLRTAANELLWARLESEAAPSETGGGQFRTVLLDVTKRKRVEQELLQLQHQLEQRVAERTGLLALLRDLAAMANRASKIEEAIQYCLEKVCNYNGWSFGHAWLPADDDPDELIAGYSWYEHTPQQFERLRERLEEIRVRRGEGLVGRVFARGTPEVTTEVRQQLSVEAAPLAEQLGIRTVGAFPILVGSSAVGVMEFFSDQSMTTSERLINMMCDVGTLLGRVVERQKAVRQLQASENHYRTLVETAGSAIVGLTPDHKIMEWNRQAERIFGWSRQEVLGTNYLERFVPTDIHEAVADSIRRELAGELIYDYENAVCCRDGSTRMVSWNAARLLDDAGRPVGIIAFGRDVTEQKQAEQARKESEERLRAILDAAPDAIVSIDSAGIIKDVNPATERIFGYSADEMLGHNVRMLMPSPYHEEHDGYITRYLETGDPRIIGAGREVRAQRKDGEVFPIDLAINEVAHIGLFVGIIRDISRHKELEKEVIDAAADEQRRIGRDIHDGVGQELTGLRYMAQTHAESLARKSSPDAKTGERMTEWLTNVQRQLRGIIRQLVLVEVDQRGLVAALRGLAQQTSESHDLVCEFQCPQPVTVADAALATHLYRIVQEAVANATRHAQATKIRIELTEKKDVLTLQVIDDGVGIRSTAEESTGVGLRSMEYRAGLIGATLAVRAGEHGGTQVICTVLRGGGLRWMANA